MLEDSGGIVSMITNYRGCKTEGERESYVCFVSTRLFIDYHQRLGVVIAIPPLDPAPRGSKIVSLGVASASKQAAAGECSVAPRALPQGG